MFDDSDDYTNEQKQLENWVMELVKENQQAEITKENFIKTVREIRKPKIKVNKQQITIAILNLISIFRIWMLKSKDHFYL